MMMADTVTVACKLPHGLVLRLFGMQKTRHPVLGGGYIEVEESYELEDKGRVLIGGIAAPFGHSPASPIANGFALTYNVDAEFFALWLSQNDKTEIVRNRLIFAVAKQTDIPTKTAEVESVKSGLEPLDPLNLPREFRGRVQRATDGPA
jgi:hypothetical protein